MGTHVYTTAYVFSSSVVFADGRILHNLPEGNSVWGVTSVDNLIYVLRDKALLQISVYDADSYRLKRRITVPSLGGISDIASCPYYRCLYIAGCGDKCLHTVALLNDDDVTSWPVSDKVVCLSVTNTHSVLVTCDEVRKIKEFSTDGKLLRQIQLPWEVLSPCHTIQLSSGEFVVCHGDDDDLEYRVCLIDSDGLVVDWYDDLFRQCTQSACCG